jgi:hypothetical protein
VVIGSLLGALFLGACGQKEEGATEAGAAETAASVPIDADTSTTTEAASEAAVNALAAELTQVVRRYAAEKQRAPKSFEELVGAGYLPTVPTAPGGRKFTIDKNLQVTVVGP